MVQAKVGMAIPETDLADLSSENLALYLIDIRLPAPIDWWPFATGWWVIIVGLLLAFLWWAWWLVQKSRSNALPTLTDQLFTRLKSDGDTAAYCHQMSKLLRGAALRSDDRKKVASLHGAAWVHWMESTVGWAFSTDTQDLLRDDCYRASPRQATESVHRELVSWLNVVNQHNSRSSRSTQDESCA